MDIDSHFVLSGTLNDGSLYTVEKALDVQNAEVMNNMHRSNSERNQCEENKKDSRKYLFNTKSTKDFTKFECEVADRINNKYIKSEEAEYKELDDKCDTDTTCSSLGTVENERNDDSLVDLKNDYYETNRFDTEANQVDASENMDMGNSQEIHCPLVPSYNHDNLKSSSNFTKHPISSRSTDSEDIQCFSSSNNISDNNEFEKTFATNASVDENISTFTIMENNIAPYINKISTTDNNTHLKLNDNVSVSNLNQFTKLFSNKSHVNDFNSVGSPCVSNLFPQPVASLNEARISKPQSVTEELNKNIQPFPTALFSNNILQDFPVSANISQKKKRRRVGSYNKNKCKTKNASSTPIFIKPNNTPLLSTTSALTHNIPVVMSTNTADILFNPFVINNIQTCLTNSGQADRLHKLVNNGVSCNERNIPQASLMEEFSTPQIIPVHSELTNLEQTAELQVQQSKIPQENTDNFGEHGTVKEMTLNLLPHTLASTNSILSPFNATVDKARQEITSEKLKPNIGELFKCILCNYYGQNNTELINHYKLQHRTHGVMYTCKDCSKSMKSLPDFLSHIKTPHTHKNLILPLLQRKPPQYLPLPKKVPVLNSNRDSLSAKTEYTKPVQTAITNEEKYSKTPAQLMNHIQSQSLSCQINNISKTSSKTPLILKNSKAKREKKLLKTAQSQSARAKNKLENNVKSPTLIPVYLIPANSVTFPMKTIAKKASKAKENSGKPMSSQKKPTSSLSDSTSSNVKSINPHSDDTADGKSNGETANKLVIGDLFKCVLCGHCANNQTSLVLHYKAHHRTNGQFSCTYCDITRSGLADFLSHLRRHQKEEQYKCPECSYSHYHYSKILIHMRRHNNKEIMCDECGFLVSNPIYLKRHKKIHNNLKKHKCTECDFTTRHRTALVVHLRRHTGSKPYMCLLCDYSCAQNGLLTKHLKTKHPTTSSEQNV